MVPVRIKGKDSAGSSFEELAHTLDVTSTGMRLGAVRRQLTPEDEITVFYRRRKTQYRVVWTKKLEGTSEFQVGLQAVMQEADTLGVNPSEVKARAVSGRQESNVPAVL